MLLKLDYPTLLADTIGIISELVNDVKIKITDEGLILTAIDPANVAMVGFIVPKHSFSTFEKEATRDEILGINLQNLKAVLKRCKAGSSLVLENEDNKLKIQILKK